MPKSKVVLTRWSDKDLLALTSDCLANESWGAYLRRVVREAPVWGGAPRVEMGSFERTLPRDRVLQVRWPAEDLPALDSLRLTGESRAACLRRLVRGGDVFRGG